jgi:hypothetical protein
MNMNYKQAIESLSSLVQEKNRFSEENIKCIEKEMHCIFPDEYKLLLQNLGPCNIFSDQSSEGIEIIDPRVIKDVFRDSFDNVDEWIGGKVMPVGIDHCLQEVAGYIWNRSSGSNFLVMSHEYYFDDIWNYQKYDSDMWSRTLNDWIIEIAETKGQLDVH